MRWLYETKPGRMVLLILTRPFISRLIGVVLKTHLSARFVSGFIRRNNISMEEYPKEKYKSFNDFFTRHIRPETRPVDASPSHLIAPCDGLLSVYRLQKDTALPIKRSVYTAEELLRDSALAAEYEDGFCLVFRLSPQHYHRYCYPETGTPGPLRHIPGILHTVRPIAWKHYKVFTENTREYITLDTERFGRILQMEVGAMLVGKIDNYPVTGKVERGQEKGKFLFGGSTILLLVQKDRLFLQEHAEEIPVKQGQKVAELRN